MILLDWQNIVTFSFYDFGVIPLVVGDFFRRLSISGNITIILFAAGGLSINLSSHPIFNISSSLCSVLHNYYDYYGVTYNRSPRWFNGSMVQWFNGSMVQWFNGSMVQWFNGPMVQLVEPRNLLTLGSEFESRCSHTAWNFSSLRKKKKSPTSGERLIIC